MLTGEVGIGKGIGLHGMTIPPGEVVRLTKAEVLSHPLCHSFGPLAHAHELAALIGETPDALQLAAQQDDRTRPTA